MSYKTGFYEGRLGIGLSSTMGMGDGNPRYPLDINGDIRLTGSIVNGAGHVLSLVPQESLWTIGNSNLSYTGGNVGIGTTDPKVKLNVLGGGFLVDGTDTVTQQGCHIQWNRSGNHGETHIINNIGGAYNNGESSGIKFAMTDSNGTVSDKMFIRNDGNVGIGTTSPGAYLHVRSTNEVASYAVPQVLITADPASNYNQYASLELRGSYIGNTVPYGVGIRSIYGHDSSYRTYGDFSIYTSDRDNGNARTDRLTVTSTGNVGIGTTIPLCASHIERPLPTSSYPMAIPSANSTSFGIGVHQFLSSRFTDQNLNQYGLVMGSDGNCYYLQHLSTNHNNYYKLSLNPKGGNVGIGTPSPESILELSKSLTADDDYSFMLNFKNPYATHYDWSIGPYINNNNAKFSIRGGADGFNNLYHFFTIHGNGNVGIGTTNPETLLTLGNHPYTNGTRDLLRFASFRHGEAFTIRNNDDVHHGRLQFFWGNSTNGSGSHDNTTDNLVLSMIHDGRIGIKTDTPVENLSFGTSTGADANWTNGKPVIGIYSNNGQYFYGIGIGSSGSNIHSTGGLAFWGGTEHYNPTNSNCHLFIRRNSGNVGIGTTNPGFPLEVSGHVTGPHIGQVGYMTSTGHPTTSGANSDPISLKTSNVIWSQGYIMASSDRRIKENIVDLSDNFALEMVRNIPVKYYEYKDKLNKGKEKTIGFIAQEVKEQLPIAVSILPNIIPNEMRMLENTLWEEIIDGSNNTYKLTTDLQDVSDIKYRFYVSNDPSGNDECIKEIVGNQDNTFSFDTSYNNVFCYGKEVDDFHTLDKQKLFALNFSATQELDRKVIALENENAELKAELAAIKQHLGI